MKKAAIIIVNWNGKSFLKNCLNAVYKQTYKNFDIYFVDNGSIDNSLDFVIKNYPKVKIIKLNENTGFAKGNNEGIKKAFKDKKVEYIVCLNNDTIVDKYWLKELIKTAEKDKKIGAVGSKMIYFYDKDKINTMGIVPLNNGNAINLHMNEPTEKYLDEEKIFGPCAGAALYKREVLEKIGLFDEEYFCYLEDVDLAYRINRAGYHCFVNPKSKVLHIHSATASKNNDFKWFLINRNSLINAYKYLGIKTFIFYPFTTFNHYKKFLKEKTLKDKAKSLSKFKMSKIILKSYFSALKIIFKGDLIYGK